MEELRQRSCCAYQREGRLFNHILTRSLHDGMSNLFAIKHYREALLCPVAATEMYIQICDLIGAPARQGSWFPLVNSSSEILPTSFDSSAAQARLTSYTKQLSHICTNCRVTLHVLRSGCAVLLALAGTDLGAIMDHVSWKTTFPVCFYIKLNRSCI